MRVSTNSHAQLISNLKMMVGQLVFPIQTLAMTVKKDKFLSQLVPNPKGVHEVSGNLPQQHKEVRVIMTSRKDKEVDSGDTSEKDHLSYTVDSEKLSPKEKKERSP